MVMLSRLYRTSVALLIVSTLLLAFLIFWYGYLEVICLSGVNTCTRSVEGRVVIEACTADTPALCVLGTRLAILMVLSLFASFGFRQLLHRQSALL
jgi:hypothetical protein